MQGKSVLTETGRINPQVLTSTSFVRDTMQLMKKSAHSLSHIINLSHGQYQFLQFQTLTENAIMFKSGAEVISDQVTTNSASSQRINQIFWPRPIEID